MKISVLRICIHFCLLSVAVSTQGVSDADDPSLRHILANKPPPNSNSMNSVTLNDDLKTLNDDIYTVKRLKLLVELLSRLKGNDPMSFYKTINSFERNQVRRLKRERTDTNETPITSLNHKLDDAVRRNVKSGRGLMLMFVRGLRDIYPDVAELLTSELRNVRTRKRRQP